MTGPETEREKLIAGHHYLCIRAARKFLRDASDRADLEQVAAIGLIKAVDRYDAAVGTPFEAFAWVFILGELMHYVRDFERTVRVPRRIRDMERRWSAMERELTGKLGRMPSASEIADALHINGEDQHEVLRFREAAMVSVESLRAQEHRSLSYTMDTQVDRWMLESAMSVLTPLERHVLTAIYEDDVPIVTVAEKLGYSRRHITRLHRAALDKLRFPIEAYPEASTA